MGLHLHIRGVSGRQGIFLTGKPQQLLVFDDGLVLTQASGWMSLAPGGGGTAGGMLQADVKRHGDRGEPSGREYADAAKRSTFVSYDAITAAELGRGRMQNRLVIDTRDGTRYQHSYQPAFGPDEQLVPLLAQELGDRFVNTLPR